MIVPGRGHVEGGHMFQDIGDHKLRRSNRCAGAALNGRLPSSALSSKTLLPLQRMWSNFHRYGSMAPYTRDVPLLIFFDKLLGLT